MGIFGDPHQKFLRLAQVTVRKMEQKGKPGRDYKGETSSITGWHVHTLMSGHWVLGSEEIWLAETVVLSSTGKLYKHVDRTTEYSWESYGGTRVEEVNTLAPYTLHEGGDDRSSLNFMTSVLKRLPSGP